MHERFPKIIHKYLAKATLVLILCFLSCKKIPVKRAFYYWRTGFELSETESAELKELKIDKLYLRFFDIIKDKSNITRPESPILFRQAVPQGLEIIPVVFIKNEVFINSPASMIDSIAKRTYALINQISTSQSIKFSELQLDCDWTEGSRTNYFQFIKCLRKYSEERLISATIRLHQVKFSEKTGVPPVDKGMLMFYNMGNISLADNDNSIFESSIASQYSSFIVKYPLPLDAVLPIFHWAIHASGGKKVKGLIENISERELSDSSHFKNLGNNFYRLNESFILHGNYFEKNDLLKFENIDMVRFKSAVNLLQTEFSSRPSVIALFACDSSYIQKISNNEFEKSFDSF